jgi:hypothetical protein
VKRRSFAGLIGVLTAGVVVAGCGGSDSVSNVAFIQQADAVCAKAQQQRAARVDAGVAAFQKEGKPLNGQRETQLVAASLPPLEQMSEELGDLNLPSDKEQQAEAVVAAFQTAIDNAKADPASVLPGRLFTKANHLGEKFGFKRCSGF